MAGRVRTEFYRREPGAFPGKPIGRFRHTAVFSYPVSCSVCDYRRFSDVFGSFFCPFSECKYLRLAIRDWKESLRG